MSLDLPASTLRRAAKAAALSSPVALATGCILYYRAVRRHSASVNCAMCRLQLRSCGPGLSVVLQPSFIPLPLMTRQRAQALQQELLRRTEKKDKAACREHGPQVRVWAVRP